MIGALDARIDGVAELENVAENDFGDGRHRRVLEVEFEAAAVLARMRSGRDFPGRMVCAAEIRFRINASRPARVRSAWPSKARPQIDGSDFVEGVWCARWVLLRNHQAASSKRHTDNTNSREPPTRCEPNPRSAGDRARRYVPQPTNYD